MLEWEKKHMPTLGKPVNLRKFVTMGVLVSTIIGGAGCKIAPKTKYQRRTRGYKNNDVVCEVNHIILSYNDKEALSSDYWSREEKNIYDMVQQGELDSAVTDVIKVKYVKDEKSGEYVPAPPETIRVSKSTNPRVYETKMM